MRILSYKKKKKMEWWGGKAPWAILRPWYDPYRDPFYALSITLNRGKIHNQCNATCSKRREIVSLAACQIWRATSRSFSVGTLPNTIEEAKCFSRTLPSASAHAFCRGCLTFTEKPPHSKPIYFQSVAIHSRIKVIQFAVVSWKTTWNYFRKLFQV